MNKILLTILALAGFCAAGQERLTDINDDYPRSSSPRQFLNFNDEVYFLADHIETGLEIWKTDGTANGTTLVKDINPGQGSSVLSKFIEHKGNLYFVASDGVHGYQLWVSDGTSDNTHAVTTNMNSAVTQIASNGEVIFYLKRSAGFLEVWKTDGTAEGTVLVKGDIPAWNQPANLISAFGLVFFTVQVPSSNNSKVWRSDGTEAGTFAVTGEIDGDGAESGGTVHPYPFFEYNGAMYFIAREIGLNPLVGLYKSDGTVAGTSRVAGLDIGNELIGFSDILEHNGKMYFSFFGRNSSNLAIWESDGTALNTKKVFGYAATNYYSPSTLCSYSGDLFFTCGNADDGTSLIKLNTSTYGFEEVAELAGPSDEYFIVSDINVNRIVVAPSGQLLIKSILDTYDYAELWRSDGTTAGTLKLANIVRTLFDDLIVSGDQSYFAGSMDTKNFELWKSDGTVAGTSMTKDVDPSNVGGNFTKGLGQAAADRLIFTAYDETVGTEPWVTDGTSSGTSVIDVFPGASNSSPLEAIYRDGYWFFVGRSASGKTEFFKSDGTATGTISIADLTGENIISPDYMGVADHYYLISVFKTADYQASAYAIDIATGDFTELKHFGGPLGYPPTYAIVGNEVFFTVNESGEYDLWKTDGTADGTVKVADANIQNMVAAGGLVYFVEQPESSASEVELHKSDGTEQGTVMVKDLNGSASGSPANMFAFGSKLVFTANDEVMGKELWITDGTAENTFMLKDIFPGAKGSITTPWYRIFENNVYFAADDGVHGVELWKSDGTSEGTVMVSDIVPGPQGSNPAQMSSTGGKLYFSAYTPENGNELWVSDGTSEGTLLYLDLMPGPRSSFPRQMYMVGDHLVFIAFTESTGTQVWSYSEPVTSIVDAERPRLTVFPNPSSGIFKIDGGNVAGSKLAIYNVQGREVKLIDRVEANSEIDLNQLPAGLYIMKFSRGRETRSVKVVKSR